MTRLTRMTTLAGSASALVLGLHLGAGHLARLGVEDALARAGAQVRHGDVSLDLVSGRVTVTDLRLSGESGWSATLGRVTLPSPYALVGPALAAGDVTVENVSIAGGAMGVTMPRIELTGTDASRETVLAIFDKTAATPLSQRLAAVSAAAIVIPEVAIASEANGTRSAAVYKAVRLDDVKAGVARSFTAAGGTIDATDRHNVTIKGSYGAVSASDMNLPLIAKVYGEVAGPGDTELQTAYSAMSLDSMTIAMGEADKGMAKFSLGKTTAKDIKAKPSAHPILVWAQENSGRKPEEMNPEERQKFFGGMVDLFESFSIGSMEMNSWLIEPPGGMGKGKIDRVAFASAQVGKPNEIRIEGLDVTAVEGYGRVGLISHSGWSYKTTLSALREAFATPGGSPESVDPRSFIPEIGTITVRDVDLNVPDSKAKATDPNAPNIRMGIKGFELQASNPLHGIPTSLHLNTDHLTLAIPPGTKEDGMKDLVAMGYKDLDLSSALDLRWAEATSDLRFSQQASIVNMGSYGLKGSLGSIAKEVFTGDTTTAQIALLGATVKDATVTVENKGIFEKALEYQAKKQKKSADQLRKELAAGAQVGIPAILGNSPNAKAIATATTKFVAKPGRLTIAAAAKDPAGLGLADIGAASSDPRALLDSLNITATAE